MADDMGPAYLLAERRLPAMLERTVEQVGAQFWR